MTTPKLAVSTFPPCAQALPLANIAFAQLSNARAIIQRGLVGQRELTERLQAGRSRLIGTQFEAVDAAARHAQQLVFHHRGAGGAEFSAISEGFAQQSRLGVGAAVRKAREFEYESACFKQRSG